MASINAKLIINETGNGVMDSVVTNTETNNISILPYTTDITSWFTSQTSINRDYQGAIVDTINGAKTSKYGTAKYGVKQVSDNQYVNQYNGLMFRNPSDLNEDFKITIVGTDIIAFNIYFDNSMGQYPTEYTVYSSISGETRTFTNSDNVIEISDLLAGYGTTEITITQWALPNIPIAITFVENVEIEVNMNKRWIDNFETESQSTSNPSTIEYGGLANTGNIKLIDKRKDKNSQEPLLYSYSKMGYLNANLFSLYLYINGKQVQHHISTSSPYYANNNTLTLELTNDVQKWNDIIVPSMNISDKSVFWFLEYLFETYLGYDYWELRNIVESKNAIIENGDTLSIYDYLIYLDINNVELQQGSLLNQLNKICQATQINYWIKDNGEITFASARPLITYDEKAIVVPYSKQYSTFDYSILVDNRYDMVSFDNDTITNTGNKNVLKIQSNELLDDIYDEYTDKQMKNIVKNTILSDYSKGIKTANLKVFPSDLYDIDGVIAKNWKNGEILEIDDVIVILDKEGHSALADSDGNDVYFRIVDRKVIYEGQVLIELSLREIKN